MSEPVQVVDDADVREATAVAMTVYRILEELDKREPRTDLAARYLDKLKRAARPRKGANV